MLSREWSIGIEYRITPAVSALHHVIKLVVIILKVDTRPLLHVYNYNPLQCNV